MQDLVLSLNKNVLKVVILDKSGLKTLSTEISKAIAEDSRIIDAHSFAETVDQMISQLSLHQRRKLALNFVIEPQDAVLKFVTVNKRDGEIEGQILTDIRDKLEGVKLEDLYFSYQKIAPFVYQFVGIKKDILEKYIEVSNVLGIELRSIIPWVLVLPKYVITNQPAIFISNNAGEQVVALSELNGVFFTAIYKDEQNAKELQQLVQELSIYKRPNPITKVFTLNYESFSLDPGYEVSRLDIPNVSPETSKGYETNLLINYVLDSMPDVLGTQLNFINLLPIPVAEKKNVSLVQVGAVVASVVFILLVGGFVLRGRFGNDASKSTKGVGENTQVLSGNVNTANQSTQSKQPDVPNPELKKSDLKIRVENGAGVPGVAAKTRDFLNKLGYNIVEIGNADVGREDTILKFKSDKINYKDLLMLGMKQNYPNIVADDSLVADKGYDVLIIVGSTLKLE